MQTEQTFWKAGAGWTSGSSNLGDSAQLVFIFGCAGPVRDSGCLKRARTLYPKAHVVGCTTAGEIHGTSVAQDSVVMTALSFEYTGVRVCRVSVKSAGESRAAGEELGRSLPPEGLSYVCVFSEGLCVNASQLVRGVNSVLPAGVPVTGGFAGDADRLEQTLVWCDGEPEHGAVAIGFYGERLVVSSSATGVWGPYGPDRLITRSEENVLYELDGRPALGLYKSYLGEHAAGLPATGLLFPIVVRENGSDTCVLRAPLAINEAEGSVTFAGDVPQGAYVRFMRGTIERLIEGTEETAQAVAAGLDGAAPQFALIVSCNGRRHVLKQRLEEELETVRDVFGAGPVFAGFYSYGEIAPPAAQAASQLHNETLMIAAFSER